ncbi:regucalcin-like [Homarus americanus]|uniref:Regucalcin n=1 Tax=Homarus americanus TaxID=6706 RepID=A0A8J5MS30_HOMAM|nr:regucalcin-like [Homarus americanus]XP_042234346.1 regucalcin-like [Homarus americanus]KAG7162050.1 Regucalcin-like 4 [Homarus americanus]
MSGVEIKQVVSAVDLGEGPHWVENKQCLLFVDIANGNIHRYYPQTNKDQVLHVEEGGSGSSLSFVVPIEGTEDLLIVGLGRSFAVVQWSASDPDQHTVKVKGILHTVEDAYPFNRFNDGKCDPQGRLWAGTMDGVTDHSNADFAMHKSSLYCLDTDLNLTNQVNKVSLSNGLAWSPDRKTFYYIDSLKYSVDAFDYDDVTYKICNRRTVVDYKAAGLENDIPDGMCNDETGNLWVACFSGNKIICIDPKIGKIVRTVELPAKNITSVCWGGADYSTLFVTSAKTYHSAEELATQPAAGCTFAITGLGVKGLPPTNFKADLQVLKNKIASCGM